MGRARIPAFGGEPALPHCEAWGWSEAADILSEAARLQWLYSSGILTPEVLAVAKAQGYVWLVMEWLSGENAVDSPEGLGH